MARVADTLAPPPSSGRHPWLAALFALGAIMCALILTLLLFPGSPLDGLWRFNPEAQWAFHLLRVGHPC
ncbi:MAG TPA: hypothetical protein VFQ83_08020 [Candidatus Udaeobacter sp.]|nr:hypothetical protein [Candidatus Udaeobacter sp.]